MKVKTAPRPRAPSTEDMRSAVDWLRSYEAAPGESGAPYRRVADWLAAKVYDADTESMAVDAIVTESILQGRPVSKASARTFWRRRNDR